MHVPCPKADACLYYGDAENTTLTMFNGIVAPTNYIPPLSIKKELNSLIAY